MRTYQRRKNSSSEDRRGSYKILMMFPSVEDKGGVVSFCQLLTRNLASLFDIEHLTVGNRPWNRNLIKRLVNFSQDALNLKSKLKKSKYHIIHLNPSFKIFSLLRDSFYLSKICRWHGGQTVVMFHGWNEDLAEKIGKNSFLRKIFFKIYQKVELILVLSNKFKEQLVKMGIPSGRVKVVTTMYEVNQLRTGVADRKIDGKINILFMARLVKSKGVYIAAEVGRLLVKNGYTNFKLTFAGDGPESEGLRSYIDRYMLNDYLFPCGYVTGERKLEILEANDIFLYPSYYGEGCPIVILEAMGYGLAVIGTSMAAIPEIVKHNENGFIIESKDSQEFYEAVKKLIEDKELLKGMQNFNKIKAAELYEAKVVTKKFEALYMSMIGEKERSSISTKF